MRAIPARWTPRGAVRARLLASDSATYRITLEGRTLARGIAARDEEIVLRAEPPERGWNAGTVELEPDELRADDVRHFAVWIGAAPAVAMHPLAGAFAHSALDALVQSGRASVGNEIALVPADEATKLPALLIAPSDPIKLGAANRALERLGVPWRFGAAQHGESVVRAVDSTRALEGVTTSRSLHARARHRRGENRHASRPRAARRGSSRARATCSSLRRSHRPRRPSRCTRRSCRGSTTCSRSG